MDSKIAIIGLSGRYPDAETPEQLFNNLLEGKNSIRKLSKKKIIQNGVSKALVNSPNYRPFGTILKDIDKFDNEFFSMTPTEARVTDPQQRLFLTCAYQALENAGYSPSNVKERMGVFGSESSNEYYQKNIVNSRFYDKDKFDYVTEVGNDVDSLSTRVSYKLNLKGPSLSIQSGCSSSLVALNYATKSVLSGECSSALVGGVGLWLPTLSGYVFTRGSTFSNSGKVSPFDNSADGMVRGNGCSVIVIKKLSDAIKDHNYIYGVLEGLAINNDGNQKIGYTAPSVNGQINVINDALKVSGIDSNLVEFIETHGTGTKLGDPIEFRALAKTYGKKVGKPIYLGSIKANIGHLDAAAGITGLIKILLSFQHHILPKQINFSEENRNINLNESGFSIARQNIPLATGKHYAAFTSLGIGGTNAHGIVSSFKNNRIDTSVNKQKNYLIVLTGNTMRMLVSKSILLAHYLDNNDVQIRDVAYTLKQRFSNLPFRQYFYANSIKGIIQDLNSFVSNGTYSGEKSSSGEKWKKSGDMDLLNDKISLGSIIPLPSTKFVGNSYWIIPKNEDEQISFKYDPQLTTTQQTIRSIVEKSIGKKVNITDTFDELDSESLMSVIIVGQVSERFSLNLDPNILEKYNSVDSLAKYVQKCLTKTVNVDPFQNISVITRNDAARANLFLIHPAGGSVSCYKKLTHNVRFPFNIYGVGFPNDIPVQSSIDTLADYYANEVNKAQPSGKIILGGYSFGGNEAVAVADRLKRMGRNITDLLMIDSIPPEGYKFSNLTNSDYQKRFPGMWPIIVGKTDKLPNTLFTNQGDLNDIISQMRENKVISAEFTTDIVKKVFTVWAQNHKALAKQNLPEKMDLTITLLHAQIPLSQEIYDFVKLHHYKAEEWGKYCNKLRVIEIPGDHFSIFKNPEYLKQLQETFKRAVNIIVTNS